MRKASTRFIALFIICYVGALVLAYSSLELLIYIYLLFKLVINSYYLQLLFYSCYFTVAILQLLFTAAIYSCYLQLLL